MNKSINRYFSIILIYAGLALVALGVFWQVYNHDFINYDDPEYVAENEHVKEGLTRENIIWSFTTGRASNWHPVTWLSHMLDCQLFGTKAGWHHLTNLLLHIANILLLFIVLKKMTGALWQSAFVAALFALHPLHVESVAWVAERKDVLSTLFLLLTMLAYTGYVKKPNAGRYLLTLLLFAFGLMAKPMLVTLPFVLLLLDYWPLERLNNFRWKTVYPLILEKAPLFIVAAISSVITFIVQQKGGSVASIDAITLKIRIANALVSYLEYIGKMVWPVNLAFFYPYSNIKDNSIFFLEAAAAFVVLVSITVLMVFTVRRYKYVTVGWLWYVGTLVPVIGLVQVGAQSIANRYTYIPLTGLFIIAAWGVPELLKKLSCRKLVLGIMAFVILAGLAIRSYIELGYWSDSVTLCNRAIKVTERNYLAHCLLAVALNKEGKWQEAMSHNKESLRIRPGYTFAHSNLGGLLARQGRFKEAVEHFKKVIEIEPDFKDIQRFMGTALSKLGRTEEAVKYYTEAIRQNPLDAEAHNGFGVILGRQGKLDQAVVHLREAVRIRPDYAEAYYNIGYALAQQGKFKEAEPFLTESVRLDTASDKAHYCLAGVLMEQQKYEQAIEHFKKSIELAPDNAQSLNGLAWLLATSKDAKFRNPEEAVKLAQKTCELSGGKEPMPLDTLAAAYAAAGEFSEAVSTQEKALNIAETSPQASQNKELIKDLQNRLSLYRRGRPYIELDKR